jgi:hypothetical protein
MVTLGPIMAAGLKLLEESTISVTASDTMKTTGLFSNQSEAFCAFSSKRASVLPIQTVGQPPFGELRGGKEAQCCVKTGYIEKDENYVVKVAAGGGKDEQGQVSVFSVNLSQSYPT